MSHLPTLWPLALAVLLLGAMAFLPRREVGHPLVGLVRVLLPSWRFFDDVQATPVLLVRLAADGAPYGAWLELRGAPPRAWPLSLIWNPSGNLQLAEQGLLERLLADVASWEEGSEEGVDSLVSYELVVNLVRVKLAEAGDAGADARFQFKLVESNGNVGEAHGDLLISREHDA